ncbi:quinoprotein glucose dehydrogenase [Fodinibius roseus]|uniref:Quinoprotein glucose dehydrogenase n=1 Tax=Fodinibius roseus TaxID=1194090 RepID=A0A1M4YUP8_9BACT|nr:pyrroloquinoline quinone-dependent dehydrogenase [Fodinibius roseus]SHF09066.1 quinoprotein glucose dehydrogenase [Fodinibius roseus]
MNTILYHLFVFVLIASAFHPVQAQQTPSATNDSVQNTEGGPTEWAAYGRDLQGSRYLPVSKINRDNIHQLHVAWSYRTGEAESEYATEKPASFQATPVMVDGTLYLSTPLGRVVALDPATGEELWEFDPNIDRDIRYGDFANRGVSVWLDKSASENDPCRRRIFVGTAQSQLIALDAKEGKRCSGFGRNGSVNLLEGLRIPPREPAAFTLTSPPLAANGLVVVGSSIADNTWPDPASGEVRAYDARTGELVWSWDPVPQNPDDPPYDEWRGEMAHKTGGANAWSVLSADPDRDLVFIPTSSAAPDYYGVLRLGDNRYANSIVALRLSTGVRVWSFQTVHHDLWDYDNAAPPALTTIRKDDAEIPAVIQATKTGMMYILNRETGKPIFPVQERPVPGSDIPLEEASPTQPFTEVTPSLSPHQFSLEQVWGITEEDRSACYETVKGLRNEGIFTPPSEQGTLVMPSNIGGAHWGGVAVDPVKQIAVVPVNRTAAMVQLIPREKYDPDQLGEEDKRLGHDYEYNPMYGTPYVMRRRLLLSPSGLPCSPPPFGSLVAINLKTGDKLWDVPLGSMSRFAKSDKADYIRQMESWGSVNLGGPIITEGGLVFIGAALNDRLHAFDIETGQLLWTGTLPASGRATPMSYQLASGEQFVVISVGGGGSFGEGDYVVAFRLNRDSLRID